MVSLTILSFYLYEKKPKETAAEQRKYFCYFSDHPNRVIFGSDESKPEGYLAYSATGKVEVSSFMQKILYLKDFVCILNTAHVLVVLMFLTEGSIEQIVVLFCFILRVNWFTPTTVVWRTWTWFLKRTLS